MMDSYRPTTPFHHSTNHASRTKTPGPSRSRKQSAPEPPRRTRTPLPYEDDGPWQPMVNTYEWVMVQEVVEIRRQDRPHHQHHHRDRGHVRAASLGQRSVDADWRVQEEARRRHWEEAAYDIDAQARQWMAQEEARRMAALREAEKTRLVQEEVRRIQARVQQKREAERVKMMEERRRAQEEYKERERRQRQQADKAVVSTWKTYESRWATIPTSNEELTFQNMPWPLLSPPPSPASITLAGIAFFLLSPLHSEKQSNKERIKEALRRWHPDRFRRLMSRVREEDKVAVEEAVGVVARCLNDLLNRQGNPSMQARY